MLRRRVLPALVTSTSLLAALWAPAGASAIPSNSGDPAAIVTDGPVYAIAHVGNLTYVGGIFTAAGPPGGPLTPRANLAVVDESGALTPIAPVVDGQVNTIAVDGTRVFIGGTFTHVNGVSRNTIAALDAATGATNGFDPDIPSEKGGVPVRLQTRSLVFAAGTLYAATDQPLGFARVPYDLNPQPSGTNTNSYVITLTNDDDRIYAGGAFTKAGPMGIHQRSRLLAFDPTGGVDTDWAPTANGTVYALAASGLNLYLGGLFTTVNGTPREHIALIDGDSGTLLPFNPGANGFVRALALRARRSTPVARSPGSADRRETGSPASISRAGNRRRRSELQRQLLAVAAAGPVVYAGGQFTEIGGRNARSTRSSASHRRADPAAVAAPRARRRAARTRARRRTSSAPRLSAVSLTSRRFRVALPGRPPAGRGIPRGTTLRYTSSEAGSAVLGIQRPLRGRRAGSGACVTPSRAPRGARRCTLWSTVGSFSRVTRAGRNAIAFSGRLNNRALRPGDYRFRLTVGDAVGNRSGARTISFEIAAPTPLRRTSVAPSSTCTIGAPRFELGTSPTRTERATRLRHAPMRRDYLTTIPRPPCSSGRRAR